LFLYSAVVPVTFTETVQEVLAARVPPERLTLEDPATAVTVPPQVLFNAFGVAIHETRRQIVSKATPVSAMPVFGFVMLKVSEVEPFNGILAAPKALVIVGGIATVRLADAVLPVPPLVRSHIAGGVGVRA